MWYNMRGSICWRNMLVYSGVFLIVIKINLRVLCVKKIIFTFVMKFDAEYL